METDKMVRSTLRIDLGKEDHRRAYGYIKALHGGMYSNLTDYVVAAVLTFEKDAGDQEPEISDEACKKIARFVREELREVRSEKIEVQRYGV